jgi:Ca-activated chloride channel homolog
MFPTKPLKSHAGRRRLRAACAMLASSSLLYFAAFQAAVLCARAQAPAALGTPDPTKPETQPPLDVDRDPIPSPDDNVPAPVTAANTTKPSIAKPGAPGNAANGPAAIQKQQNGVYILHANVDEVLLNCAVLDQKGQPVMGLNSGDFRVWEDGVPQVINSVQQFDLPVSMGILIDNSGSMRDKRAAVNNAAYDLLNGSNPQDEAFVVNFSDHAYLDQGFTQDRTSLDHGIARFDSAGTTALYDAVAASADELSKHGKDRRQVLLIISDGADNASRLTLQEAIRRVQGLGGPVVYTIGLLFDTGKEESDQARYALETLSQQTGGVAYFPRSMDEVRQIAAQVAKDIREQYVVDYHSSRPFSQGGYRSVRVEAYAPHRGTLYVRTKKGYFAQPQSATQVQEAGR